MKKKKTPDGHRLHLVTTEEAALIAQQQANSAAAQPEPLPPATELDSFILKGLRRYEQAQKEFDEELFGDQDLDKIGALLAELQLLRERLSSYGVRVRP